MDDKLKKVCDDFSKLGEEQQDYVLGIMQALVFAQNTQDQADSSASSPASNVRRTSGS
ncbi:MAG: hypothetical protein LBB81_07670 [Treponema sp.]|jgi:hypothetical protein|nr:hypothetical protein [Treponema sp.]